MIAYRAALGVPRELVQFTARLLLAERRRRGTPRGSRAQTCLWEAVVGLRCSAARITGDALDVQDRLLVSESGESIGIRLAEGRHAAVGARYQDAEANESSLTDVILTGWDARGKQA